MYPQGNYINSSYKTLVVFEKDLNNPDNEGFFVTGILTNRIIINWFLKKGFQEKKLFKN